MHFTNPHMSQGCQIHNFLFMLVYLQKIANQAKLMLLPWFDACGGELSTSICLFMCVEVVAWGAMALSKVIATLGYEIHYHNFLSSSWRGSNTCSCAHSPIIEYRSMVNNYNVNQSSKFSIFFKVATTISTMAFA
jgi:hypothetical protein